MSKATHTPGPFVVGQSENQRLHGGQWGIGLHLESSGNANGCDLTEANRPYMLLSGFCSEADAHRFAAAPELLEALEEAHRALMHYEWYANPKSGWASTENLTVRGMVDAAIAKAKGGAL